MIQTLKSRTRVSFDHCDPFAHLNNAKYLSYFLNARETQLRENKVLDIFNHAQTVGKSWVVIAHDIRYLRPARLGEELELWSRMLTFDSRTNLVEFLMISPETRQLKAILHTRFAYVSLKDARPAALEEEMKQLFQSISLFPDQKIKDFQVDQRIAQVKSEIAQGD